MKKLSVAMGLALILALNASWSPVHALATDSALAQTEVLAEGSSETEKVIDGIASLAELYNRVQYSEAFDDYQQREAFLMGMATFDIPLLQPINTVLNSNSQGEDYYNMLSQSTRDAIQGKLTVLTLGALTQDPLYQNNEYFRADVDWLQASFGSAIGSTLPQLLADYPSNEMLRQLAEQVEAGGSVSIDLGTYLQLAWATPNYDTYADLFYVERNFVTYSTREGDLELDTALMQEEFTPAVLTGLYEAYAELVKQIDPSLLNNLPFYENINNPNNGPVDEPDDNKRPQTPTIGDNSLVDVIISGGDDATEDDANAVKVPDTGILGLLGGDLTDLGAVVLLGSTVVAVVLGAGFVARLYLRHKMKF